MGLRLAIVLLAILSSRGAFADDATILDAIGKRLASDDPKERAWGAHDAARSRLPAAVPVLIETLRSEARLDRPESRWVVPICLDALVRLKAVIREEDLAPHLEGHLAECIGLMAIRPADYRRCLRGVVLEPGNTSEAWIAAGNLLASIRDPGFVLILLRGEFRLLIRVKSREYREPAGLVCSDGYTAAPPAGYPPIPRYVLKTYGGGNPVRTIAGPEPIHLYVHRQGGGCGRVGSLPCRAHMRSRWLNALRGKKSPDTLDLRASVRWGGDVPLLRDTRLLATELLERYRACVADLVREGLVDPENAGTLQPLIRITYLDRRDDRRHPLPEPPDVSRACPRARTPRSKPFRRVPSRSLVL